MRSFVNVGSGDYTQVHVLAGQVCGLPLQHYFDFVIQSHAAQSDFKFSMLKRPAFKCSSSCLFPSDGILDTCSLNPAEGQGFSLQIGEAIV